MKSKNNKKTKVLVAMSGGVDSSVAAALLVSQGYDVTGVFVVNYEEEGSHDSKCWTGDYQDALRVAAHLGMPLTRWDFKAEYKKAVLDYMYEEYRLGRTPNPDVLCNKFIKFGAWLDKAKDLGFDKLATGHYARIANTPLPLSRGESKIPPKKEGKGGVRLVQAKDDNKDQTYFLHQLNQEQLRYTLFPLGNYTKPQVRKLAKKFGLPNAEKEESMGICFVGEVPMKEFLMKEIKQNKGKIILSSGEVVGEHDGLSFYTIGQRCGLSFRAKSRNPLNTLSENPKDKGSTPRGISDLHSAAGLSRDDNTKPLYVVDKKESTNELVVGYEDDPLLYKKESKIIDINWIGGQEPKFPLACEVRLRHRQPLQKCVVLAPNNKEGGEVLVQFTKPQRAVTPGQFAVFYRVRRSSGRAKADKKHECLGGGVIK